MNSKSILLFAFSLFSIALNAQNVFHDRNYWKAAPSVETVKSDEQKGNDATQLNANAFDATVYAIIEKAPDATVKYLLSKSENGANKITHDGRTYIFWAAYVGNTDLMEYLQKNGAKTDIIEDHGYTIMNFAASTGQTNTKVYDLCLKFGANLKKDLDHDGANALLLASGSAKDMTLIDYFSSKGIDLKSTDANGNGILNYVSKNGNRDIMENLLKKGLKFSDNAMIMAAQGTRSNTNTLETYQFLESKGVKPTAIGKNGENALHFIVRKEKQAEIIAYFLSKGVDVNQTNKDGNNVLMYASAANPDVVLVKMLAEKTKDINARNAKGQSALSMAVQSNSPEIVGLLLEKGADTKIVDIDGNNLTYYLAQSYNPKKPAEFDTKLKALQSKGFDLNSKSKNGNTLLHIAVAKNNLDLIKRAQGLGIDVNMKNAEGMTALHKAAMISKNDEMLKYLVSIGAKTDEKTDMAETAYDLASENEALKQNKIAIDFLK
ncbi:ankyrin repeat domain-containing protein [Flavobacterium sp. MAH-1]|uniref:Ankyrin repeat domain-containing protein n=1 Tax=Flavobacterium agri TaxID=2743471 RepID=A0A7Y8Y0H1_9FLAO|nr:ankyrin repeat domain-containing protein [Flavobacterium agri]NUY80319.1 ankyrin repeat domain-containing protein [Flavobacterium agri]NYA70344.1 ankyrin repeat domain-containing protein [Flavobacterium agri]